MMCVIGKIVFAWYVDPFLFVYWMHNVLNKTNILVLNIVHKYNSTYLFGAFYHSLKTQHECNICTAIFISIVNYNYCSDEWVIETLYLHALWNQRKIMYCWWTVFFAKFIWNMIHIFHKFEHLIWLAFYIKSYDCHINMPSTY